LNDETSSTRARSLEKQPKIYVCCLFRGESCVIFPRVLQSAATATQYPDQYQRRDSSLNIRRLQMAKKNAAPTKSEILATISKDTGLAKKQVADVFESLGGVVKKSLKGSGLFTLPGLLKMKVVKKPATKAREGVNPFTGEKMMFKAKPASKKVRIAALKSLKEMVN
jgi:DNA-binding protein HU-beta